MQQVYRQHSFAHRYCVDSFAYCQWFNACNQACTMPISIVIIIFFEKLKIIKFSGFAEKVVKPCQKKCLVKSIFDIFSMLDLDLICETLANCHQRYMVLHNNINKHWKIVQLYPQAVYLESSKCLLLFRNPIWNLGSRSFLIFATWGQLREKQILKLHTFWLNYVFFYFGRCIAIIFFRLGTYYILFVYLRISKDLSSHSKSSMNHQV